METNRIIDEIRAVATLNWGPEQKAFYKQRAADIRPVECVRMCDVFNPDQLDFFRDVYHTQQKQCYKNASTLVTLISHPFGRFLFPEPVKYVEGFSCLFGVLPFEHAFVKIGDKYIDPTFERELHLDVRKEMYASLIELDPETMTKYLLETGYYGNLYQYDYLCKHRPETVAKMRARNSINR